MNIDLCRQLCKINKIFYAQHAQSFSSTRLASWDGWRCLFESVFSTVATVAAPEVLCGETGSVTSNMPHEQARKAPEVLSCGETRKVPREMAHEQAGNAAYAVSCKQARNAADTVSRGEADNVFGRAVVLLDVALGNARFEHALMTQFPNVNWKFYGVDCCDDLLTSAFEVPVDYTSRDVCEFLYTRLENEAHLAHDVPLNPGTQLSYEVHLAHDARLSRAESLKPDDQLCHDAAHLLHPRAVHVDYAVSFGFMHHIASFEARALFLQLLCTCVKPGGAVCVSLWQFMKSPRLSEQALRFTPAACAQYGIAPQHLEQGDYFLSWQNDSQSFRYCHSFSDSEIQRLVECVKLYSQLECMFYADGKEGNLNCYLVLRRVV